MSNILRDLIQCESNKLTTTYNPACCGPQNSAKGPEFVSPAHVVVKLEVFPGCGVTICCHGWAPETLKEVAINAGGV